MTNLGNLGKKADKNIKQAVTHVDVVLGDKSSQHDRKRIEIANRADKKMKLKRLKKLNRRTPKV